MSLFLGKIHFWLFNKVLWFEGLEDEIIKLAQEEGLNVEALSAEINAKYGQKTENKNLEEIIDTQVIFMDGYKIKFIVQKEEWQHGQKLS